MMISLDTLCPFHFPVLMNCLTPQAGFTVASKSKSQNFFHDSSEGLWVPLYLYH